MASFTIFLTLALAAQAVLSTPLERFPALTPVGALSSLVSHVPTPAAAAANPVLLLCSTSNCASCTSFATTNLGFGNCFFAGNFVSVGISNPNNVFHVDIDIAPANCTNWVEIPQDNVCFNINGGPFTQYGALHFP